MDKIGGDEIGVDEICVDEISGDEICVDEIGGDEKGEDDQGVNGTSDLFTAMSSAFLVVSPLESPRLSCYPWIWTITCSPLQAGRGAQCAPYRTPCCT